MPSKDKSTVAKTLRINPYFVEEYATAASNYPMKKVSRVIALLREADMKGKGVDASTFATADILKELLVRVMG